MELVIRVAGDNRKPVPVQVLYPFFTSDHPFFFALVLFSETTFQKN